MLENEVIEISIVIQVFDVLDKRSSMLKDSTNLLKDVLLCERCEFFANTSNH